MQHEAEDSIAAIATPAGRGGVGIIRISGPAARTVARDISTVEPRHCQARPCRFLDADGRQIDFGLLLFFQGPRSFTGEDVLELHAHGGPVVLDMLLARVLELGCRLARPGEFSERAFLNGKIDLLQAEAIADLIDSASSQAARSAVRTLQGEFSSRIQALQEQLTALRAYIEASLDFPEEEIDFLHQGDVRARVENCLQGSITLGTAANQGMILHDGLNVVIAGRPNVGKSSLLNHLAARERAIVSAIPGTTRDTLSESILIDGMPLHVIDTAGLRDSDDPVEQEGMRRAQVEVAGADALLLMLEYGQQAGPLERDIIAVAPSRERVLLIRNKIDLSDQAPLQREADGLQEILCSVREGLGMDLLQSWLKRCAGMDDSGEGSYAARRRHLDCLRQARARLQDCVAMFEQSVDGELLAEELRLVQQSLGQITGEFTSDDLLGEIFSSFCIGK